MMLNKPNWVGKIVKTSVLCLMVVLLYSYKTTSYAQDGDFVRMNPYEITSTEAAKLKYPPGVGVGAYWGDGRFNVALDNFYDEKAGKCFFQRTKCFRQEGDIVYAAGKSGWLVLNLASATYDTKPRITDFPASYQEGLKRVSKKSKGNVYFNPDTLMPKL